MNSLANQSASSLASVGNLGVLDPDGRFLWARVAGWADGMASEVGRQWVGWPAVVAGGIGSDWDSTSSASQTSVVGPERLIGLLQAGHFQSLPATDSGILSLTLHAGHLARIGIANVRLPEGYRSAAGSVKPCALAYWIRA